MLDIPFKIKLIGANDDVVEEIPMNICTGFVGLTQDPKTFQLKPEMGWIIQTADTNEIPTKSHRKKRTTGINLQLEKLVGDLVWAMSQKHDQD